MLSAAFSTTTPPADTGSPAGAHKEPTARGRLPASHLQISEQPLQQLAGGVSGGATLFFVGFTLSGDAFARGLDPIALLGALAEEATLVGTTPLLDRLPDLSDMDPVKCYLGFETIAMTTGTDADLRAVFEFCPASSAVQIVRLDPADSAAPDVRGPVATEPANDGSWRRLGEILVEDNAVEPEALRRALDTQRGQAAAAEGEARTTSDEDRTIRVKQARLDALINQVGELVTARNALLHLQHFIEVEFGDPRLTRRIKETTATVNRAVGQLQADVLSLRMIPLRTVSQRLPRIVRDVAHRQGKLVELRLTGEDTELDKTVADALIDPLIHLVRNAVDHGIETPDSRRAAGKSETGHVDIVAWREGNSVAVEIRDDGAGIDRQRVIAAAVRKGMLEPTAAAQLTDAEALDLVFASGLSTATEVSDISGRGVGMDVVRSNIARTGGSVHLSSNQGMGTTAHLHLPLTLSVFRALIVRAGDGSFALPLDAVRATEAVEPAGCRTIHGRPVVPMRGLLVGLVSLANALGLSQGDCDCPDAGEGWQVVVVEADGQWIGLVVDELDPPQEIMVKPVDGYLSAGGAIAGASVLGDGRVALALDPAGVAAAALAHARTARSL